MRSLCVTILLYTGIVLAMTSEDYLREAENYLAKGEIQAAVIQLKNALQQDPDNVRARLRLGKIYLRAGQGRAAEKELSQARKLGAKPEEVLVAGGLPTGAR
jgi:Tfp pilus assembly protein PilF